MIPVPFDDQIFEGNCLIRHIYENLFELSNPNYSSEFVSFPWWVIKQCPLFQYACEVEDKTLLRLFYKLTQHSQWLNCQGLLYYLEYWQLEVPFEVHCCSCSNFVVRVSEQVEV